MWTYLLLCCLAGTVFSSDSSPASITTTSNSSLAATSDHLATGLNDLGFFPKPKCVLEKQFFRTFDGRMFSLKGSDTIMVQASCRFCDVYDNKQVLILVSDGAVTEYSKDLMVILGTDHVFQVIDTRNNSNGNYINFAIKQNNKKVDLKGKNAVTLRDRNKEVLADLKLDRLWGGSVDYVQAQFPQHNFTVGYWAGPQVGQVLVHLDESTYRREKTFEISGFCNHY